ncbi:site-specific integrase [Loigolactobacillus backii]|uniref:tyrosine-type recombinase/integrase n=1 Tax=Loigolactobacillus backii TaxID=375175 RepID=UPI000C1C9B5E|nr:site-specific integrase [Loigolactobacillus backii]PIO83702.1 site-specific integrase [Loigolactobacillus backii]
MATIIKRGASYRALVSVSKKGKKSRITKSFDNKNDAKLWALRLELKKGAGVDLVSRNLEFADYFDQWLEYRKKPELKESSYLSYQREGKRVRKLFKHLRLCDLNDLLVQEVIDGYAKNHAKRTVNMLVQPVRAVLKYAFAHGLMPMDISSLIRNRGYEPEKKRNVALSITNLHKLREYCFNNTENEFCVMVLLATDSGLRRGELLGLKPTDISKDIDGYCVHVRRSISPFTDDHTLKTRASARTVTITGQVYNLLLDIPPKDDGYIFVRDGFQQSQLLAKLLKEAGIKQKTTMHGLRDTHASFLFSQDIDLGFVSERLGHASLVTTQRYYIELMPEKKHAQNGRAIDLLTNL